MLETGLVFSRFLHYAALMALFGASLFPLYTYPSVADPRSTPTRRLRMVLFLVGITALVSGLCWFAFTVANMSGTLAGITDREAFRAVLLDTDFGHVWAARLALAGVVLGLTWIGFVAAPNSRRDKLTPLVAAALLATLAGVGHARVNDGMAGAIHVVADGAHLIGAGAWLGGLVPLAFILARAGRSGEPTQGPDVVGILLRFSSMGYLAVAVLVGSGLINSWFLVGSIAGLTGTPYGRILIVKLCLFAAMLALAASNRFILVPSLTSARAGDPGRSTASIARLRRHVLGEQVLGCMVLLIVSVLGTMQPAVDQP